MSTCAWLSDALVPALTDPDPIHNLYLVNAPRTYMYSCTESNSQQADTDLGMHTHPYIYVCMPDSILSPPLYGGVDRAALMERPAGGFDCVYNIMVLS